MTQPTPHVEISGINKHYGGVHALADINLTIETGSVHALVGENGAGKSTLGKIISGVIRADDDEGQMIVDGRVVQYTTPYDALTDGIAIISQEIALVPKLTVLENVYLGFESRYRGLFINKKATRQRFDKLMARTGFALSADTLVSELHFADLKKVEILKAVARNARLIVMDEPTSALPDDESERLLQIIRQLRDAGTTIVFVSHFLKEVLSIANAVTVLRNGRLIQTTSAADQTPDLLVEAMLGRAISLTFPEKNYPPADAPVLLAVNDLSQRKQIKAINFEIRAGEIVGLAGLVGSGRSHVARSIFGAESYDSGNFEIDGRPVHVKSPYDAVKVGIAMLPESRKDEGLLMNLSVGRNVTLPHIGTLQRHLFIQTKREQTTAAAILQTLDVRPPQPDNRINNLSGGNQQKVLFAKWLYQKPRILIADEPSHGVDVGAKRAIYQLITQLAAAGMGILLISSELEEVIGLAHRVLVLRQGRIVAEFKETPEADDFLSEEAIMHAAFATGNQ